MGSKAIKGEDFEETGRVDEYLLYKTTKYEVSKPIEITSNGIFLSDRGLAVSNCGMFLLMAMYSQSNALKIVTLLSRMNFLNTAFRGMVLLLAGTRNQIRRIFRIIDPSRALCSTL